MCSDARREGVLRRLAVGGSSAMDKERKKELDAFYDKQKQQTNQGAASGRVAIRRKGPPVRFPQPFTRSPAELFRHEQETSQGQVLLKALPAPMNNNSLGHIGKQPVKYHNVVLERDVGPCSKDTKFEVATVDYFRGEVKLYTTERDFYNDEPAFAEPYRVPGKNRYSNLSYVREILAFLQRGHSLLEPECRCTHGIGETRAAELGISLHKFKDNGATLDPASLRDGECKLETARCSRTSAELAREIAVGDLYEVVDKTGVRLVDKLVENQKIVWNEKGDQHEWAFKATSTASSKQELLQVVRQRPLGLKEPSEKDFYNGVKTHVEELVDENEVYRLTNPDIKSDIIYPRLKDLELDVDKDLKDLWLKFGGKEADSTETLLSELRKEELIPTKQKKPEPKVLGKRKGGPGSRRRSNKKANSNDHLRFTLGGGAR